MADELKKFVGWAFFYLVEVIMVVGIISEMQKSNPNWLGIVILLGIIYAIYLTKRKNKY